MFPLNGHNVTWPQHRRASMSNSRQLWVNPHQFGLEGSDWIHNNELLVRLRTSLGLPSEGVLKMSPKIPHWGCSLNVFVIVLVFVFVVVFLLVRSCILIALIKCLKGQKSQGLLFEEWRCSLNVFVTVFVFVFVFVERHFLTHNCAVPKWKILTTCSFLTAHSWLGIFYVQ